MQSLPIDIIQEIANFLSMTELATLTPTHTDFLLIALHRRKRLIWCRQQFVLPKHISLGHCVDASCNKQKASCIQMRPLATRVLTQYCRDCAKLYIRFKIEELI